MWISSKFFDDFHRMCLPIFLIRLWILKIKFYSNRKFVNFEILNHTQNEFIRSFRPLTLLYWNPQKFINSRFPRRKTIMQLPVVMSLVVSNNPLWTSRRNVRLSHLLVIYILISAEITFLLKKFRSFPLSWCCNEKRKYLFACLAVGVWTNFIFL